MNLDAVNFLQTGDITLQVQHQPFIPIPTGSAVTAENKNWCRWLSCWNVCCEQRHTALHPAWAWGAAALRNHKRTDIFMFCLLGNLYFLYTDWFVWDPYAYQSPTLPKACFNTQQNKTKSLRVWGRARNKGRLAWGVTQTAGNNGIGSKSKLTTDTKSDEWVWFLFVWGLLLLLLLFCWWLGFVLFYLMIIK